MSNAMQASKVINGTYGRLWFQGAELTSVKSFECKQKINYEDIKQAGKLNKSRKMVGYELAGTFTLNKIDDTVAAAVCAGINAGIQPTLTLIGVLADPSSYGETRVQINGITIDNIILMKFEAGKLGEEEISFEAETYQFLDQIT